MLMHRNMAYSICKAEEETVPASSTLKVEPFIPLSQRVAAGQNDLHAGLQKLRQSLPQAEFDKYIESLVALRLQGGTLWLVTDRAMHRSIIERSFLDPIRTAFGVHSVRVLSQA
ncbi:MAG TPA: DnaA N-terminal domain-containing protein [Negativicutes bacterium]|nr:DnaA N-terminal domain-containing protein [Negativicutes bacterium]